MSWPELLRDYPDIADYDRVFVREIPQLLASAGLQVISTTAAPSGAPVAPAAPPAPAASASGAVGVPDESVHGVPPGRG